MPIDISKGWVARKGLSVDDSLRRGRCRSQVGPTGSTLFAAFKRNKPWITIRIYDIYDSINFFVFFFLLAFPRNILNHLQNRKQLKKKHKKVLSHQCGLFVCFFCSRWLNLRMYYHIKSPFFITICWITSHLWRQKFPLPNRCHPETRRFRFGALFSLMKSFGSKGEVAFNHFTWRSWGSDERIRLGGWLATRNPGSTHQVEGKVVFILLFTRFFFT